MNSMHRQSNRSATHGSFGGDREKERHGAALYELHGIYKSYESTEVLRDVSFSLNAGEVVAVVGENGAGKSTLLRIAAGLELPDAGRVFYNEKPIYHGLKGSPARVRIARRQGISLAYQDTSLLSDLTVTNNLLLGLPRDQPWPKPAKRHAWAATYLQRFGSLTANINPKMRVDQLTPEQCQVLETVKSLVCNPKILLLDEPTSALSADQVHNVLNLVAQLRDQQSTGIIYVSHRLSEVREITDRIIVLRDGAIVKNEIEGNGKALDEELIVTAMVGRPVSLAFPEKAAEGQKSDVLINADFTFCDTGHARFQVRAGEIVGLAGIAGNGQREALRALAGLEGFSGTAEICGKPMRSKDPAAAKRLGAYFLSDDRMGEQFFQPYSVEKNMSILSLARFKGIGGWILFRLERNFVNLRMNEFGIRAGNADQPILSLSGGNQQKTAFARLPSEGVKVLLASEPTQGVDANSRLEIYRILRALADRGTAVVVQSSEQHELAGLCDRVLVWDRGCITAEYSGEKLTGEAIVTEATKSMGRSECAATQSGSPFRVIRELLDSDYGPHCVITLLFIALLVVGAFGSKYFLTLYNFSDILTLSMAMGVSACAAFFVIMIGGIDVSVGPMMGLTIVMASYLVTPETGLVGGILGTFIMIAVGALIGAFHYLMAEHFKVPSLAVTIASYIALQGVSLLMRPVAAGEISAAFIGVFNWQISLLPDIPLTFFIVLALVLIGERLIIVSRAGLALRAVGSDSVRALRNGINRELTILSAYMLCSILGIFAGFFLAGRVGFGDARSGLNFTVWSLTAVVIGGTSLMGGRGSLSASFLAAILLVAIINLTTFLNFNIALTFAMTGFTMLFGVALYSAARKEY